SFLLLTPPPRSTLFPYTTLFRSLIAPDAVTRDWLRSRAGTELEDVHGDADAEVERELVLDLSDLEPQVALPPRPDNVRAISALRSEEHTSELQSLRHLVCRLLLE